MSMHIPSSSRLSIDPTLEGVRLVVFGQGSTENRVATLLRLSAGLRAELNEVAQGPLYLLVEFALRRLIDDLKDIDRTVIVSAESLPAESVEQALARLAHSS